MRPAMRQVVIFQAPVVRSRDLEHSLPVKGTGKLGEYKWDIRIYECVTTLYTSFATGKIGGVVWEGKMKDERRRTRGGEESRSRSGLMRNEKTNRPACCVGLLLAAKIGAVVAGAGHKSVWCFRAT